MTIISLSDPACFDYVEASGADARSFLQGQLTCNLDKLDYNRSLRGALCNLKGRVIADFQLYLLAEETVLLQGSPGTGQKIVDTLSRYAVFSKVELGIVDGPAAVFGLIGESAAESIRTLLPEIPGRADSVFRNESFLVVRSPGRQPRYQLWCLNEAALEMAREHGIDPESGDWAAWKREEVLTGIAHVTQQTSELYTPQLLNYDISGVVDFEKGCYTGQEVVARMHYRAKPKKRLYGLTAESEIAEGAQIVTARNPDKAAVELVAVAPPAQSGNTGAALGIVSTELAGSGEPLQLAGNSQETVKLIELDYAESQ